MKKILVPLDGSECAELALQAARPLARQWNGELLLLRVEDFYVRGPLGDVPSLSVRWTTAGVQSYLDSLAARLSAEGLSVRTLRRTGRAGPKIRNVARREAVDVIVMSSHGRSAPLRWLVGSVTEDVLRQAPSPVLVVRAGALPIPADGFHRALVPIDGSEYSYHALPQVEPFLAAGGKARLLWATNLTPLDLVASEREACLRAMEADLAERFPDRDWLALDGDATGTIVDEARQGGYDLIAMSTHGRSGFRRFILGSVTERVVRHSTCAVLVFPPTSRILTAPEKPKIPV